jgi:hypothetical protein
MGLYTLDLHVDNLKIVASDNTGRKKNAKGKIM